MAGYHACLQHFYLCCVMLKCSYLDSRFAIYHNRVNMVKHPADFEGIKVIQAASLGTSDIEYGKTKLINYGFTKANQRLSFLAECRTHTIL